MGVAVEMSLLSYTQAEIWDLAYALPVNGGHVWFTSHSDVRECPAMSHYVAVPEKYWYLSEIWLYHVRIMTSHLHPV